MHSRVFKLKSEPLIKYLFLNNQKNFLFSPNVHQQSHVNEITIIKMLATKQQRNIPMSKTPPIVIERIWKF